MKRTIPEAGAMATPLGPLGRIARWIRSLRPGRLFSTRDSTALEQNLASARAIAEKEALLREAGDSLWTAERLRVGTQKRLQGSRLFVISNREPYEHERRGGAVVPIVPASGLVTAIEPVLCACDGTWIAHGSGGADREVVDSDSRVRVPPGDGRYTLRRVWLSPDEFDGYYHGFANEGLWPLCHIAHTRPVFRSRDWEHYQQVNQKFSEAVLTELEGTERPCVLVQDYHLALLPRLVKEKRPDARVGVFWHIPWPNPEAFGICPWQPEILEGLLGADIVSFHVQGHCSNFLRTVDRTLECRIDWDRLSVNRRNHSTIVRARPISVANPEPDEIPAQENLEAERSAVRLSWRATGLFMGVGVDRVDYTKGISERFLAVERFLEKAPEYQGVFSFVQIGAPSRTRIKRYQELLVEVEAEADRINRRFQAGNWRPILLFSKHHGHREIRSLYRAADFCMVTSLHDGMNLVAKEFVSSREDDDGVLILSRFTGAAVELNDALIVNPYDIEQLADAIRTALEWPVEERRSRMSRMRRIVREHNVYRWAADLISDLTDVRPAIQLVGERPGVSTATHQ